MTDSRTYLDHNATSPLRPDARAAMIAVLDGPGNASSIHAEGRSARSAIEAARDAVAAAAGCKRDMVTFVSGGTEANNIAIKGSSARRLVLSATEHPCVIEAARATGKPVSMVPVDRNGIIDLEALAADLAGDTAKALVCVMLANNETGAIQPVAEVARIAAEHDAMVHCDAVQAFGKVAVRWPLLGVDTLTLTGHKFGGPQGAGALIVREGLELAAMTHGGGQEQRRRPGTENLPAIVGFGAAVTAAARLDKDYATLRDRLEAGLKQLAGDLVIFSEGAQRIPNTCCFAIPGMAADTSLMAADLEGLSVSSGSACSSGKVSASHVLTAMGMEPDLARCAIRTSLGWNTTEQDVERFLGVWRKLVERHRQRSAA